MALPLIRPIGAHLEDGFTDEILPGSLPPRATPGKAIEPRTAKPALYYGWSWLGLGKHYSVVISQDNPKGVAAWDGGGGWYPHEGTVEELCQREGVTLAKWDEALASFVPGWTAAPVVVPDRPRIPVLGKNQIYRCATCGGILGNSREAAELHDTFNNQTHAIEAIVV